MKSDFIATIWLEEKMPPEAVNYQQCEVCTQKSRIIWGEGNPQAPVFIILDNPGAREDKGGKEYVCGTRETLQIAIHEVGLAAEDVYITNLLKCRPLRKYDKEKARAFSKPFLIQQIKTKDPRFIVCLGDTVVQSIFNDTEAHVRNLRGNWQEIMGYPSMVSYHPLAVRRRPNLRSVFIEDWQMLSHRFFNEKEWD